MNKIFIIVGILSLLFCYGFIGYNEPHIKENIKIIPISISQEGYSDIYKIECKDKEFYTTYPDRLNFEDIC